MTIPALCELVIPGVSNTPTTLETGNPDAQGAETNWAAIPTDGVQIGSP